MERPKIEDYQQDTHDCWGVTDTITDVYSYARALNEYIDYLENIVRSS